MTSDTYVINLDKVPGTTPLHPLGASVRTYILDQLNAANTQRSKLIVLTGGPVHFSAGADLKEFSQFGNKTSSNVPSLIDVVTTIEKSTIPVVAVIAGTCLGGGLELTLACHARVLIQSSKCRLGLPEVHVGVLPGAGGTIRLPRLVGLQQALQMILTGMPVTNPIKAVRMGLVDAVVDIDGDFEQSIMRHAKKVWADKLTNSKSTDISRFVTSSIPLRESPAEAHVMLHAAQLQLPRLGSDGCLAAMEAIRAGTTAATLEEAMQAEYDLFVQTLLSEQGQARRHAFFAVRQAQKLVTPSLTASDSELLAKDVSNVHVGVVGAGTMGAGIAYVLLQAGYVVHLVDVQEQALARGSKFIETSIVTDLKRKNISDKRATDLKSRLLPTTSLADLAPCKLVVEAVVERMKLKQDIFRQLDRICNTGDVLLVSNTSTLSIDGIASAVGVNSSPSSVAGWHFFSPAHRMKLVEVIHGSETNDKTIALLQLLTKRIGKIGVVVGNCDGFVGNRLLKPYSAEAFTLLTEGGGSVASIDRAIQNFGMALGPFQMGDLAGNDVAYNIRVERGHAKRDARDTTVPPNRPPRYSELADIMVTEYGRLGQKTSKGWYDYDPSIGKGRVPLESKEMNELVAKYNTRMSLPLSEQEIVERVFFPMVNEGFKCLEENIARCPSDIDVVYLYGYGWPMYRGGPMYWADNIIGLPRLLQKLVEFSRQFPDTEHFVPSKLLEQCVSLGVKVEDYYKQGMHKTSRSRL